MVNKRGGNVWLCIPVLVTRLFAERNFCRKSFFVALRIRERSDMAAKKDGL